MSLKSLIERIPHPISDSAKAGIIVPADERYGDRVFPEQKLPAKYDTQTGELLDKSTALGDTALKAGEQVAVQHIDVGGDTEPPFTVEVHKN